MNVTLDTNCLIDLENNGANAPDLRVLVALYKNQKISLRISAISASERQANRTYATNFADFRQRTIAIGLAEECILKPMARLDITFLDWCIFADDQMLKLERQIHYVLFPNIEFDYGAFCKARDLDHNQKNPQWLNAKCDVLALWCHIYYGGDIFVTSDENFHKETKKPRLIGLGARDILTPRDVVKKVS